VQLPPGEWLAPRVEIKTAVEAPNLCKLLMERSLGNSASEP
jgi:hypothetical protein